MTTHPNRYTTSKSEIFEGELGGFTIGSALDVQL